MTFQDDFEQMRSLEQDLTFLSAKTEFDESNIPFKEKNLGIQNQDSIYTNLGLLLSDQCKHTIKVAVFNGETQNDFQDRNEFTGSLFKQMHEVYSYIDFRNQKHSSFSGLKRIDKRDYPEVAIREALLNLIIHRLSEASDNLCYEKKNIMRSRIRKFFFVLWNQEEKYSG